MRRLDGGRREVLSVPPPCVLSVEGSVANLRRAGLRASLASAAAPIRVRRAGHDPRSRRAADDGDAVPAAGARAAAAPRGATSLARVRELTDAGGASAAHGETVTLAPRAAAERIVAALREWGELG